jgi:hypothetical protein
MAHQISGHLWNAAILALSVAIAVVAERLTSAAPLPAAGAAQAGGLAGSDISGFIAPLGFDSMVPPFQMPVRIDPFDSRISASTPAVAYGGGTRTVRPSGANSSGRVLTAILVANDRRVAVIDDAAVSVGGVLSDGTRVSAIQPSKVFLVDTKGRFHTLTLTNRGQ